MLNEYKGEIMDTFEKTLESSLIKVEEWVEKNEYKGYEPFDGLSSFLYPLTFGNLMAERLLQQLVRQSPINLRPIFGISRKDSTKGRGYMAWGYIYRHEFTGQNKYKDKVYTCLDWLCKNKAPNYTKTSWGNHFPFSSRAGKLPRHEPIIVWSSLIGQVFLNAYELYKEKRFLETAIDICGWILDLPREKTDRGTCLSYVAYTQSSIHNSNMLGAALLARTGKITSNQEMLKTAKDAMEYSCSRQREDGSWYYGEGPKTRWIDNFHTGYNLDSLKCYIDSTSDYSYESVLSKGLEYYKKNFFESTGRPKYYQNRAYPIDIQCASQSIDTLATFALQDKESRQLAIKVANWTIKNMQDRKGHFHYRQYPLVKAKTPMLHWGQATMYKALCNLQTNLDKS